MNLYVVKAESENGFWSNEDGWVNDIADATRFPEDEANNLWLPLSGGLDATLLQVHYEN